MQTATLPQLIKPERNYGSGHTWFYKGFIINDWTGRTGHSDFFCLRPVEMPEITPDMDKFFGDCGFRMWGTGYWYSPKRERRRPSPGLMTSQTGCFETPGGTHYTLQWLCQKIDEFWEWEEDSMRREEAKP